VEDCLNGPRGITCGSVGVEVPYVGRKNLEAGLVSVSCEGDQNLIRDRIGENLSLEATGRRPKKLSYPTLSSKVRGFAGNGHVEKVEA